jgi:predicted transcriptional regulator
MDQKPFSKWSFSQYMKFLDSKSLLTKRQKSYFFKVHEWRNSAQHSGMEPKKELVEEALKMLEPHIICGVVCASAMMNKPIIHVDLNDPLSVAVTLMKKHDFSQLPVFENYKPIDSISEKTILKYLEKFERPPDSGLPIKNIMDKTFPIIKEDAALTEILKLLQTNHAVLVRKDNQVVGIITKADLLKLI